MKRLPFFLIIVAAYALISEYGDGSGYFVRCVNDQCVAAATTSWVALLVGPALAGILLFLPRRSITASPNLHVGVLRRLGATLVDMHILMIAVSGFVALPILLIEGWETGQFEWQFQRNYTRSSDWLIGITVTAAMFAVLSKYHHRSLLRNRPTLGQYVLGYQIAAPEGGWTSSRAGKRLAFTLLTLCIWPVTAILAARHPEKKFWFDTKTGSNAVRFTYAEDSIPAQGAVSGVMNET